MLETPTTKIFKNYRTNIKSMKILININYSVTTMYEDSDTEGSIEYRNVNYDMGTGKFLVGFSEDGEPWLCSDFGGTYEPALIPEIAVFEN